MVENNKSQFEEYKYTVAVIGGAVLITIVLAFAVGKPLFDSTQKTAADLEEKKIVLQKLQEKLSNLKNLQSREEELKAENEKVLAALPEDKDVARLFVQFEKIAKESGVTVESVSEANVAEFNGENSNTDTQITAVTYNINAKAKDYASLKNALVRFEDALRLLSISEIDASLTSNDLSISFTINTYKRS